VTSRITGAFGGSPVNRDDLQKFMNIKVDKTDFNESNKEKVTKTDLTVINTTIDTVNTKLENISVVLMEQINVMANWNEHKNKNITK